VGHDHRLIAMVQWWVNNAFYVFRYRKVATDKCQGGPLVDRYKSMKVNCPVMKPAGLSIEVIPADVVPVGSNVSFRLSQDQVCLVY